MNFRLSNRQVLAAGLVLTAIFITISTANFVSGAEVQQPAAEQHSRLHPKRIFNGLKRGVSKIFGRDKADEEAAVVAETQPAPKPAAPMISQKIDRQQNAIETARRARDPFQPPLPVRTVAGNNTKSLTAPTAARTTEVKRVRVKPESKTADFAELKLPTFPEKTELVKTELVSEEENPFADFNFDAALSAAAPKVVDAAVTPSKPAQTKQVLRASQQRQTAPEVKHLLGYCPVNLRAGKFERGKPEFTTVYQGRSYAFDSQEALNEFIRNPRPYAPVLQGIDVIEMHRTGQHTEGYLSYSCDYDGQFYLFRTIENQEEFLADPARYAVPK